jgi:hypothetical protein
MKTLALVGAALFAAACGMETTVADGHAAGVKAAGTPAPDNGIAGTGTPIDESPNQTPIDPIPATAPISGAVRGEDGAPIPGVKVEIVGSTTSATTDDTGVFKLTVPVGDVFLRASEAMHKTQLQAIRVATDGLSTLTSADFVLVVAADFDTAPATLSPPIDLSAGSGSIVIAFQSDVDLDGTFGANLSLASGQTYATCGSTTAVYITDRGTAQQAGGHPLIFSNVLPGRTGILVDPAPRTGCALDPPVGSYPVEADAITHVIAQCNVTAN